MAKSGGGMDPAFDAKLQALVAASGGRLTITSGYRSTERQSALWNAALAKYGSAAAARKWVAPPGRSNHEKGKAADLKGDLKWARANAARFGLHFPMAHEPWHVEPIGLRGAKKGHTDPPHSGGSVRAHERRVAAHEGHQHATGAAGDVASIATLDSTDTAAYTWEGQLTNLASILIGGGDDGV